MSPSTIWCHSAMVWSTLWTCTGMAGGRKEEKKSLTFIVKIKWPINDHDIFDEIQMVSPLIINWASHQPHCVSVMQFWCLRMWPLYTVITWACCWTPHTSCALLFLHRDLAILTVMTYFSPATTWKRKCNKTADQLIVHQQSAGYF